MEKTVCPARCLSAKVNYPAPSPLADPRVAIPEEPPTPIWELILEQFKDQLVLILLCSAAVSFGLALFEEEEGWSAFVDPAVVCLRLDVPLCSVCIGSALIRS